jgi:hypothetical protein
MIEQTLCLVYTHYIYSCYLSIEWTVASLTTVADIQIFLNPLFKLPVKILAKKSFLHLSSPKEKLCGESTSSGYRKA